METDALALQPGLCPYSSDKYHEGESSLPIFQSISSVAIFPKPCNLGTQVLVEAVHDFYIISSQELITIDDGCLDIDGLLPRISMRGQHLELSVFFAYLLKC